MPITTLVYNVDRLPKSDHHQNNFSEVITEAFGDNVHKFMNDYTRQKKKHIEEFENIFSKFENLKESGLKIRLQDIPDRRRKNEASIRKEMRDGERLDHFTEELGTADLSDTFTGSEFNDGLENCNEIGDNLPLKETRCKVGDHIPYPLSEDFRKKRRREEEASNKKEKRKKKEKLEEKRRNFPEKSGTPDLSDVFINSEIEEKANIEKEKREKKRNFSPFTEELDTIDLRKFFKSAGGQRKYIRIAEMLEREYSSLQRFLDNVTGRDLPEYRRKRLKPFIQRYSKEITNLMEILLALEEKFRLLKKLLELWDDNWIGEKHSVRKRPVYDNQVLKNTRSEKLDLTPYDVCEDSRKVPSQKKSKHANISNVHEISDLSIASSDSESWDDENSVEEQHAVKKCLVYDNQVVKNARSEKGDHTSYDVHEDSRKMLSNMKEKPLNFTKIPEKSGVGTASTGSARKKSKHANISNVHETSDLSTAGSDSESLDDQNLIKEQHAVKTRLVYDNEVVKNTRSEESVPCVVSEDSRKMPSYMKQKPLNFTKVPEKLDVAAASTVLAQKERKYANISNVHETSDLSTAGSDSESSDDQNSIEEQHAVKSCLVYDNKVVKNTRSEKLDRTPYDVCEDSRRMPSNMKEKPLNFTKVPEKSGVAAASTGLARYKSKHANISNVHEKSYFSIASSDSESSDDQKSIKEQHGVKKHLVYDNQVVKNTRSQKGDRTPYDVCEDSKKMPSNMKEKPLNFIKVPEKPYVAAASTGSEQRKSKHVNISNVHEASHLSIAGSDSESLDDQKSIKEQHGVKKRLVYDNQVVKNTRSEKGDRTPYDVCEESRKMPSNMKEKPLNFIKVPEKPYVAAASTGSEQRKSKHVNISNVHEASHLSIAGSDSESWNDENSVEEQHAVKKHLVYDNKIVKNTRSEKGDCTPCNVCEDSRKMPCNMKEKPLNFTKLPETSGVASAITGSAQKERKYANISSVHETSDLSTAGSDSESSDDQNSIEELHAVKRPLVYDNEFVKNTRSEKLDHTPYDVCVDSRRIPSNMKDKPLNLTKFPEKSCVSAASTDSANMKDKPLNLTKVPEKSHVSAASAVSANMKDKPLNLTKVLEKSDVAAASTGSARKKSKPANISNVHETSDLSIANRDSELTVDLENSNEEHHPVKTVCDDQVVKETRSKEGDLILRVMLEDLKKMPAYKKHKLLNSAKVSEKSDLATERTGSARRKRKLANFANIHETSNLSTASSDSVKKGGKSANITKGAKISAGFKSVKKGGKSASITKGAKISADFKSARKKSKRANITNVHKTSDLSIASSGSEMNVDNNSRKENVPGNQSVEISRFEKEHVPFPSLKCLRKHPSKDNGINMLVNKSVSTEIPVKYSKDNNLLEVNKAAKCLSISQNDYSDTAPECSEYDSNKTTDQVTKSSSRKSKFSNTDKNFKYLNNGDKISVFSVVKSWNSNNRFKKYLWHGIVPICPLTRSPQTSSRVAQSFLPLDVVSTVPRSSYPLPPQTL